MRKNTLHKIIRKNILQVLKEQTFIGKTAINTLKLDPKYNYLSSTAKKDAENTLKKGDALTLGEMARPTTQGIVVNKSFKGGADKLPKLFQDIHALLLAGGNKPLSLIDIMAKLNASGHSITQQQKIRMPLKNNYLGPAKAFLLTPLDWVDDGSVIVNNRADEEGEDEEDVDNVSTVDKSSDEEEPAVKINRNIVPDNFKLKSWSDYSSEVTKDDEAPTFKPKNPGAKLVGNRISDNDLEDVNLYTKYKQALATAKSAFRLLSSKSFARRSDGIDDIKGEKGSEGERLKVRIDDLRGKIKELTDGSAYVAKHHQTLINMANVKKDND